MTEVTLTKKLEIYIADPEERQSYFDFFFSNSSKYVRALNAVYSQLIYEELAIDAIKEYDEGFVKREQKLLDSINSDFEALTEKRKKSKGKDKTKGEATLEAAIEKNKKKLADLRKRKKKEANEILEKSLGLKKETRLRDIASKEDFGYSVFPATATRKAMQDFNNDYVEILKRERTPRIYRDKKGYGMLPYQGNEFKIAKGEDNHFYLSVPLGYHFRIKLGGSSKYAARRNDVVPLLEKIISGEYTLRQSAITFENGKFYAAMTVTFETDYTNLELDEEKVLTLEFADVGEIKGSFDGEKEFTIGDSQYVKDFQMKIQTLKDKEKSRMQFGKGGKGRSHKLKYDQWEAIKNRERNFAKTYNNQVSSKIVQRAVRSRAKYIQILSPSKELGGWSYYELTQMIKNKANYYGIEAKD